MPIDSKVIREGRKDSHHMLLHERSFRLYWISRLLAQSGQGALLYGLLILVADRTDTSLYSSFFVVCSIVPALLFGLIGGWVADRLPQRPFLISLNLVRAGVVTLLLRSGADLPTIFLVTFVIWTVHQFFSPTEASAMARLVSPDRLADANALSNLALTIAQILGMVILAPVLLKLPDERILFATASGMYLAAAVALFQMGSLPGREPGQRRKLPLAFRRGWRVAASDPVMFMAFIDDMLISAGMSALVVILPFYLVDVLHTDAGNTVFVFAPAVIGLIIGFETAPRLVGRIRHAVLALVGLAGFSITIAGLGLVDPIVIVLQESVLTLPTWEASLGISARTGVTMALAAPAGFFSALTNVGARTAIFERAPEDTRGQIVATQSTASSALALLPTLFAGIAIDVIGVRPVALVIASLLFLGAIVSRYVSIRIRSKLLRTAVRPVLDPNPAPVIIQREE